MQLRTFLAFITLFAGTTCLPAQIIVTNATFPAAGDSLRTATDPAPVGITMTPPGGGQHWDYSGLNPASRRVDVLQPASSGAAYASFPAAELVNIGDAGSETYFDVTASAFSVLGIGGGAIGLPIPVDLKYVPSLPERRAPLSFFDIYQSTSSALAAVSVAAIPSEIFDSLGIPTGLFDSIRLRLTINRLEVVDAYGSLTIPGGTYEVLREKRTDFNSTAIDVHTFLGWVDISTILGGELPGFGTDTTVTYQFLSNNAKEPIAVVTVDTSGLVAEEVDFKDLGAPSAVEHVISGNHEVLVSPNPASDHITVDFKNFLPGQYTFQVFDLNGKRILVKQISSTKEIIAVQSLSEGTYIYNVINGNNRIISSGKFLKITP